MTLAAISQQNANATEAEKLLMPGEVVTSHADVEADCGSCHKRFSKAEQRDLCLDCHEDVADDLDAGSGFHGLSPEASSNRCADCHTDHIGRDADIVNLNKSAFDHDITDFALIGKHNDAECEDCHAADVKYREAPGACIECHGDDDVHKETLGTDCADCHSAVGWEDAEFDHEATDYPLIGHHLDTACLDCHDDSTYLDAPTDCHSCHAEDDAHDGRSGDKCENCHSPVDWEDTSFDHGRDTEFPLDESHVELTCDDCHSEDPFADEMDRACVACHLEGDEHDGHRGQECDRCHTAGKWDEPAFDHDRDTDYVLNGAHESIACNDCHVEPIFETELQSACIDCHREDDAHEGEQGEICHECHDEVSWEEAPFFVHDLTRFPLLGGHLEVECDECHASKVYSEADTDCVACHAEDDTHHGNFADNCGACHNPVDWNLWFFDHDAQTDFALQGAHVDVACDECHRSPLLTMRDNGDSCGGCHRADDIHDGEFGPDCGRCHGDSSFEDVRSLQ
jgi:hypothetical protein